MNFFSLFKRKILYKLKKKINIDLDNIKKKTLDELLHHYSSDKADIFSKTNEKGHGFSKIYAQHLDHLKNKDIKILEVGSFAGASAAAFSKYFTKSNIYCFDVNISNFIYSSKNIHVYGLNINNENEVKKIINFCNLKWEENCLSFHKNKTPIKTMSTAQARKPIYKSSLNSFEKYRKYLSVIDKNV